MSIKTDNQIKLSDGHTVGYAEYGDLTGKPVMHFHGTPSSRFEGDNPDLDAIAERQSVRFIIPDRPGMAFQIGSPSPPQATPTPLWSCRQVRPRSLCRDGAFWRGRFVASCAWKIPQRLTNAIIVSGTAPFGLPGAKESLSKEDQQSYSMADKVPWLFRLFLWKFARDARKNPASIYSIMANAPDADKELMTQPGVRQAFEKMVVGAFEQGARAAAYDWALIARPWGFSLREIKMPVDIWHGDADTLVPIKHAHILAEAIPDARTRFFPNEGHVLIVTHFEELLQIATGRTS